MASRSHSGVEYTLVEYAVQSASRCQRNSLAYSYVGTGPGATLTGSFNVSATKIHFTVSSVSSDWCSAMAWSHEFAVSDRARPGRHRRAIRQWPAA
jgi:hypothetical protein